jgi:hypothetical protein
MLLKFFQIRTITAAEFQPFFFKQFSFFSATISISSYLSVRANDSVTRNHHGSRIIMQDLPYQPGGIGLAYGFGNITVGCDLASRNFQ